MIIKTNKIDVTLYMAVHTGVYHVQVLLRNKYFYLQVKSILRFYLSNVFH